MIGDVNIKYQVQNPSIPLNPLFAFRNSDSTIRINDVPDTIGKWRLTEIRVQYTYPDNTTKTLVATKVGNEYIATLDECDFSGKVVNGLKILADGIDETGENLTNYILAQGDINILESDGTIQANETNYVVHFFKTIPNKPHSGDVVVDDNQLRVFDGVKWSGKITLPDVPTKTSQLENDSGFVTSSEVKELTNDKLSLSGGTMNDNAGITLTDETGSLITSLLPRGIWIANEGAGERVCDIRYNGIKLTDEIGNITEINNSGISLSGDEFEGHFNKQKISSRNEDGEITISPSAGITRFDFNCGEEYTYITNKDLTEYGYVTQDYVNEQVYLEIECGPTIYGIRSDIDNIYDALDRVYNQIGNIESTLQAING